MQVNEHALEMHAGLALTTAVVHVWHATPLPHAGTVVPAWHDPAPQHPDPHEVPHTPQLFGSCCRSTHPPLQGEKPALHANPHELPLQDAAAFATVVVHAFPHVPQLAVLVVVSAQPLVQSVGVALGQPDTQAEPLQTGVPPVQAWPQVPQLAALFARSTHAPLHRAKPALQVNPQVPPLHEGAAFATFVVHAWPQRPQFATSAFVSVHVPLHVRPHAPALVQQGVQPNPQELHDEATQAPASPPPAASLVAPSRAPSVAPSSELPSSPASRAASLPSSPDTASSFVRASLPEVAS